MCRHIFVLFTVPSWFLLSSLFSYHEQRKNERDSFIGARPTLNTFRPGCKARLTLGPLGG